MPITTFDLFAPSDMTTQRETLPYQRIGNAIRELALNIRRSGHETDVILSIAQHFTLDRISVVGTSARYGLSQ